MVTSRSMPQSPLVVVVVDPEARLADHLLRRLMGAGVRVLVTTRHGVRDRALERLAEATDARAGPPGPLAVWTPLPAYGADEVLLQLAIAAFGRVDAWIGVDSCVRRVCTVAAPLTSPPLAYVHVPARAPDAPPPSRGAERRVAERIVARLVGAPSTPRRPSPSGSVTARGAIVTPTREPAPP